MTTNQRKRLAVILLLLIIALGGCETLKGAAADIKNTSKHTVNAISKADAWAKKHLW